MGEKVNLLMVPVCFDGVLTLGSGGSGASGEGQGVLTLELRVKGF